MLRILIFGLLWRPIIGPQHGQTNRNENIDLLLPNITEGKTHARERVDDVLLTETSKSKKTWTDGSMAARSKLFYKQKRIHIIAMPSYDSSFHRNETFVNASFDEILGETASESKGAIEEPAFNRASPAKKKQHHAKSDSSEASEEYLARMQYKDQAPVYEPFSYSGIGRMQNGAVANDDRIEEEFQRGNRYGGKVTKKAGVHRASKHKNEPIRAQTKLLPKYGQESQHLRGDTSRR